MKIDWGKIEPCGKTTLGNDKKIYLEHLPKGGKQIKWSDCIGMEIYSLYDNMEYTIKIKDRINDYGAYLVKITPDEDHQKNKDADTKSALEAKHPREEAILLFDGTGWQNGFDLFKDFNEKGY